MHIFWRFDPFFLFLKKFISTKDDGNEREKRWWGELYSHSSAEKKRRPWPILMKRPLQSAGVVRLSVRLSSPDSWTKFFLSAQSNIFFSERGEILKRKLLWDSFVSIQFNSVTKKKKKWNSNGTGDGRIPWRRKYNPELFEFVDGPDLSCHFPKRVNQWTFLFYFLFDLIV